MPTRWCAYLLGFGILLLGEILFSAAEPLPALPDLSKWNWVSVGSSSQDELQASYHRASSNPQDAEEVGHLGMRLHALDQYHLAATCYRQAKGLRPDSFRWAYYLGLAEGRDGKKGQAVASLKEALQLEPHYLPALLRLAESLMEMGDWKTSEATYEKVRQQDPNSALAHYGLGRIQSTKGQFLEAIDSLKKACRLFPNFGVAHYALGMLYRDRGEPARAQEEMSLFQSLKDTRPQARDPLLDEILRLRSDPNDRLSWGLTLLRQHKTQEAISEFDSALREDPTLAQAHGNLLSAYLTLGEFSKAEEHYNAAVKLDPNMSETHFNFGLLQSQQGRNPQAAEAFRRAIEINPFYAEAHNNLAFILANEGRLEESIDHFLLAIKNQPNYRDAHFNLGQILLTQGKAREAIPHFIETIVVRDEQTPLFLFTLAKAHFQAGELQESRSRAEEARQQAKALSQLPLLAEIDQFLKQHRDPVPSR